MNKQLYKQTVERLGWTFKIQECYHPHNGDEWIDYQFKSPRMNDFKDINAIENIEMDEARYVTIQNIENIDTFDLLLGYFIKNKDASSVPDDYLITNPKYL